MIDEDSQKVSVYFSQRHNIYFPTTQYLQGQHCVAHARTSMFDPTQGFPPLEGGGLVQERTLIWVPPPQVTVQGYQGLQADQPPSTGAK